MNRLGSAARAEWIAGHERNPRGSQGGRNALDSDMARKASR